MSQCFVRRDRCGCVTAIFAYEGLTKREIGSVLADWARREPEAIERVEIEAGKKMLDTCAHDRGDK